MTGRMLCSDDEAAARGFGGHGSGAFMNPAERVAVIYHDDIARRITELDLIAFAIFAADYGRDNFTPFAHIVEDVRPE